MMTVWRIRWKTGTVLRCIVYDSVLSDRPTCTCTHTHTHRDDQQFLHVTAGLGLRFMSFCIFFLH